MKKSLVFSLLLCVASFLSAEDILFFCGGRPWGAGQLQKAMKPCGASVKMVDPFHLAGLNGVSLKKFSTDTREPETFDGITPEFNQLVRYKVIFFSAIPKDCMEKILTPERVNLLRKYVEQGGAVVMDNHAPSTMAELLPVKLGERLDTKAMMVERPSLKAHEILPKTWKKYTSVCQAEAVPGANVYCMLKESGDDGVSTVGIASKSIGRGAVWFYNGEWRVQASDITAFNHWAYHAAFICGVLSEAGHIPMNLPGTIPQFLKGPEKRPMASVDYDFKELAIAFRTNGTATLANDRVHFSNGIELQLKKNGDVGARFPGMKTAIGHNLPGLQFAGKPQALNGDNNEAIVKTYHLKNLKMTWKPVSTTLKGNVVSVVLDDGQGARMRWEFKPCELMLDGRKYIGYGERAVVETLPMHLESVVLNGRVPTGKIRRMTCYTSPRGYLEGDICADGIKDSSTWQFFCSGQPLTYLSNADGIQVDIIDGPTPLYVQFKARKAGDPLCNRNQRLLAGFRQCPVELPYIWHLFSAGPEMGNNDYVAMVQYARRHLREKCGLREFPQRTQATFYLHDRTPEDIERCSAAAEKLNFKSVWLSYCPLPIEQLDKEKLKTAMQIVRRHGMVPHPWTPGGYGHGANQPIFKEHPSWFIRDQKQNFYLYFKQHSVMDFNHPEFRKWYMQQIDRTIQNGMGAIYMDMGGQASSNVNYGAGSAPANLDGLVKIFQEFSRRNLPYSVEGMNPLAKDQALFAPEKSLPLIGREFAYVGGCPLASVDAGVKPLLAIDYFRLGMFNGTINVNLDGYALGIERVPGEISFIEQIGEVNRVLNRAHELVPAPFVRETAFGTAWIGKDTGALFFYHPVKELKLTLPPGWSVADDAPLKDIPSGSLLLLTKKK